jgi:hypothetical protein
MKIRIITIMLCLAFLGCIWIANAAAETLYTMVCKGGGNMQGNFWQAKRADEPYVTHVLTITFTAAPQAGSRQEPAPGTCAWVDRPLNAQEQQDMRLAYRLVPSDLYLHSFNVRQRVYEIPLDANNISNEQFRYLLDALYNGKLFYVRCFHTPAEHNFTVRAVGP